MSGREQIRVLFLTRYPVEGASSRYRVFQYVPHLERLGLQCRVQSFMDSSMYQLALRPGQTFAKIWATIRATVRRLWALRGIRAWDVVYLQRELLPFGPPVLERWLKRQGVVLLFDYDDALFIKKASRYNPLATLLRAAGKTRDLFRIADCTVAGNDWLRDAAHAEGGKAVTLEVAEDTRRFRPRVEAKTGHVVTIGWLGSPSTVKYLSEIEAPLRRIAIRHPTLRWEIVGGGDFAMEGIPWILSDWSLEAEPEALARFDIGLMPLPMQDWSRGKSGGKARTYMAAGVVPVVSAIGYNIELIRNEETGFLCAGTDDWEKAIEALIANPALRAQVGQTARAEVEARFAPEIQAQRMADLFAKLLAERRVS